MRPRSLRQRIAISLTFFSLLVALPIVWVGDRMNERAEQEIWQAMLHAELADVDTSRPPTMTRHGVLYSYAWRGDGAVDARIPPEIATLSPGLHDDLFHSGREWAVLVEHAHGVRSAVAIDITELESEEATLSTWAVFFSLLALASLVAALDWLARRAVAPVTDLASQLEARAPTTTDPFASAYQEREIVAVVGALNGFVERIHEHGQRQRNFVETMSHELRTPLAVILGAVEVLEVRAKLDPKATGALLRIRQTARDLLELAQVLLSLTGRKDAALDAEAVDLLATLHKCVEFFGDEFRAKGLTVNCSATAAVVVAGRQPLCEVVINNLLRNCCDHGSGTIDIRLTRSSLEISNRVGEIPVQASAQVSAATPWRVNAGLGLDLIGRVCLQLGWTLELGAEGEVFQAKVLFEAHQGALPG